MAVPAKDRTIVNVIITIEFPVRVDSLQDMKNLGLFNIRTFKNFPAVFGEIEAHKISALKLVDGVLDVNRTLDRYDV